MLRVVLSGDDVEENGGGNVNLIFMSIILNSWNRAKVGDFVQMVAISNELKADSLFMFS